jgi:transcriptional regulator with XRE-family HTH domain
MTPRTPTDRDRLLSARIRELRLLRGLTQGELAGRIGVSTAQAQKYENAADRLAASRLWAIADALGVAPADLFPEPAAVYSRPRHARALRELGGCIARMSQANVSVLLIVARALAEQGERA